MKNNWLSFTLDEDIRLELYNLGLFISKKLKFDNMSYDGIHMTSVFLGKQLKSGDIDKIYAIIDKYSLNGEFKFVGLEFFPPTKNNLIVAKFETDRDTMKKVEKIKQNIRDELKYDIDESLFNPHVTLGKLSISKSDLDNLIKTNILKEMIEKSKFDRTGFMIYFNSPMYLCGN